ncbi:tRNA cyclic N6-threonylcarbamoyladenosine(37) synthase TcdA [Desulfuribacillus stibiiarsenatis]|uniref:tRNA cyclic N6-threonylcarbamoyladenosine(37) synthase TcdA n=1 Tax=Desulfuribacillus stibiiarsenatis TaxID=1390249 RepID=A0A1E5L3C7_9FIRM|nr:tRNA threonylcarbamoyladenosine dehydratase [Desulfuribacillus stibiiarsenatis]OEH84586.1 tRNA cyclic N6-threonylcarbamoyladenosine(37) synthase TcdA [Desulfuribacillus stibiiarsenatis]
MLHRFSRTELLIGKDGLALLQKSTVAVIGVGGVGSYAVEALARSGVGHLILVDDDDICLTNINRQIHALQSTIGKEKVEVMKERVLQINPKLKVTTLKMFYNEETADQVFSLKPDYIIDAIDTISSKLSLIKTCKANDVPIIVSMGAGNKLDPTGFILADISKTSVCPMAKVIRKELKKAGIVKGVKVVYSKEQPLKPKESEESCATGCVCPPTASRTCTVKRQIPGSISYIPSVVGLILGGTVITDLLSKE